MEDKEIHTQVVVMVVVDRDVSILQTQQIVHTNPINDQSKIKTILSIWLQHTHMELKDYYYKSKNMIKDGRDKILPGGG